MALNENSALSDYGTTSEDSLTEYSTFSPKYQFFKVFRTVMSLQANGQYSAARRTFYDSLGWFNIMFDQVFPSRCSAIIAHYERPEYYNVYTYAQVEQLKFMRILTEFTRLLIDVSSKHTNKLNQEHNKRVELTPIGYSQVIDYQLLSLEFFNRLTQIQQQQSNRDAITFFNHSLGWFAGIMDAEFVLQGYMIAQTEGNVDLRFRKLVNAFSKLLTRKSITPTVYATLTYKPTTEGTPMTVGDIVKSKKQKQIV